MEECFSFLNAQLERLYSTLRKSIFKRVLASIARSIFRRTAAALTEVSTFSLFNNHPVLGSKLEAFATGLCDLFHAEGAGIDPSRMEGDIQPLLATARAMRSGPTLLREALAIAQNDGSIPRRMLVPQAGDRVCNGSIKG
mmetsp:Transcript_28021/g.71401  ORF Transcript_28021/g.71401 Transcript_28021/m.71401 type:complete len:140 (-) Transcript_28021:25-444(-)